MIKNERGSITVFLALVLVIILALVFTMVEAARYRVCSIHAARTLKTGMESLMTEYNAPLYDEYRLFLLEEAGKPFCNSVTDYMSDTLNPGKSSKTFDLFDGVLEKLMEKEKIYAGDNGALAIQKEITTYMKRRLPADAWNTFCNRNKSNTIYAEREVECIEKQVKEEQKQAKDSIHMQNLIRYIDGVRMGRGGMTVEKDFVKCIVLGQKTPQRLGITNHVVWKKIRNNIIVVKKDLSVIKSRLPSMIRVTKLAINEVTQVCESMKRKNVILSTLTGNLTILEQSKKLFEQEKSNKRDEELRTLWQTYDTTSIVFDYRGMEDTNTIKNPKESLAEVTNKGILSLVLKNTKAISKKEMQHPNNFSNLYKEKNNQERHSDHVHDFFHNDKVNFGVGATQFNTYAWSSFALDQYIVDYFNSYRKKQDSSMKKALQYEIEYVLAGQKSDKENIKEVANRLLLLRTALDFVTITSQSKNRDIAYAAAVAIVGFTGMEPLVRLTQTLLLITWSVAEALVDTAALFLGKTIPMIKKKSEISVSFPEIITLNHDVIQKKAGQLRKSGVGTMGYAGYLRLFLMTMNASEKRYRMMDLIQENIRNHYHKEFQLGTCIYSLTMQGSFQFKTRFFCLPMLENVTGRKLYQFYAEPEIKTSY